MFKKHKSSFRFRINIYNTRSVEPINLENQKNMYRGVYIIQVEKHRYETKKDMKRPKQRKTKDSYLK